MHEIQFLLEHQGFVLALFQFHVHFFELMLQVVTFNLGPLRLVLSFLFLLDKLDVLLPQFVHFPIIELLPLLFPNGLSIHVSILKNEYFVVKNLNLVFVLII